MFDVRELLDSPPQQPGREVYLPTEAEIRAACAAIQATWTAEEELSRRVTRGGQTWRVPEVTVGGSSEI